MKYFELLGLLLLCHVILCFCAYQHDGAHGASALHLFTSPDVGTKPPSSSKPPILNSRKRHSITKKKRPRTVSECLIQSFTSAIGSLIALTLTYPLQTAAGRVQILSMDNVVTTSASLFDLMPTFAIEAASYDGYVLTVVNQVFTEFSFTFVYECLKRVLFTGEGKASDILLFFTAPFAGSIAAFFQNPLGLIKGRLDARNAQRRELEKANPNLIPEEIDWKKWRQEIYEIISEIYDNEGVASFFTTGLAASCLLTFHPTTFHFLYDSIVSWHKRHWDPELQLEPSSKSPRLDPHSSPKKSRNGLKDHAEAVKDSSDQQPFNPSTTEDDGASTIRPISLDSSRSSISPRSPSLSSVEQEAEEEEEEMDNIGIFWKIIYTSFAKCIATVTTYPVSLMKTQLTARSSAQSPQNVQVVSNFDIPGKIANTIFKALSQLWSVLSIIYEEGSKKWRNQGFSSLYVGWQYKVLQNMSMAVIQRIFRDLLFYYIKPLFARLKRTYSRRSRASQKASKMD